MSVNLLISLPPIPAPWTIPMPKSSADGQAFMLAKDSRAASSAAAGVLPFEPPEPRAAVAANVPREADPAAAGRRSALRVDTDPPIEHYTASGRVVGRSGGDEAASTSRLPPEGIEM